MVPRYYYNNVNVIEIKIVTVFERMLCKCKLVNIVGSHNIVNDVKILFPRSWNQIFRNLNYGFIDTVKGYGLWLPSNISLILLRKCDRSE